MTAERSICLHTRRPSFHPTVGRLGAGRAPAVTVEGIIVLSTLSGTTGSRRGWFGNFQCLQPTLLLSSPAYPSATLGQTRWRLRHFFLAGILRLAEAAAERSARYIPAYQVFGIRVESQGIVQLLFVLPRNVFSFQQILAKGFSCIQRKTSTAGLCWL